MTLNEYMLELQKLVDDNKGGYSLVDKEHGFEIDDVPYVIDEVKKIFI